MERITPLALSGNERAATAWQEIQKIIDRLAEVSIEEKKSSVHICAGGSAFLGVHPRKNGIRLTIVLDHSLSEDRVVKSEAVSKRRYHNEVDLNAHEAIDDELLAWIDEAYRLKATK